MMPRSPSRPFLAAYLSLAAVVGCGARVTGTGGVSGTSGGGASGGGGGGMAGGSGVGCYQCACETLMSAGGCSEICQFYTTGPPNFCEGAPAYSQCSACLAMNCPGADPMNPSACM